MEFAIETRKDIQFQNLMGKLTQLSFVVHSKKAGFDLGNLYVSDFV